MRGWWALPSTTCRSGVAAEFPSGTLFAAKGMDSYAAFPLNDSAATRRSACWSRWTAQPIADAALAEALLKIFAGRIVAEIERGRADEALRAAALAVSERAAAQSVFAELVRYLAAILQVEIAFIARHDRPTPRAAHAGHGLPGRPAQDVRYPIAGTPCETVLGQQLPRLSRRAAQRCSRRQGCGSRSASRAMPAFRSWRSRHAARRDRGGLAPAAAPARPASSRCCKIFAVRAAAEVERLRAGEALQRSEASYRAIFEASEDAIFIHDWDSGAILDVNRKACEMYGYTPEELRRRPVATIASGIRPTPRRAMRITCSSPSSGAARRSNGSGDARTAACTGTKCG